MARDFPGTVSDYLDTAYQVIHDASDSLTVSTWAKPDSIADFSVLLTRFNEGVSRVWALWIHSGLLRFDTSSDGSFQSGNIVTGGVPPIGQWFHVVAVHDPINAENRLYMNGVIVARTGGVTTALVDVGVEIHLGHSWQLGGVGRTYDGMLAHASIHNTVLSDAEIVKLYQGIRPSEIKPGYLIADWPLDDYVGGTSRDRSIYGNNANLNGTVPLSRFDYPLSPSFPIDTGVAVAGNETLDSDTVYLDIQVSSVDAQQPIYDSATVYLDLSVSAVIVEESVEAATTYLDIRIWGQEEGAFYETFESMDAWDLTNGEIPPDDDAEIALNLRQMYITRKHATDGPSALRLNYDTVYGDSLGGIDHNGGFFAQWIDTLNGNDDTKTYWLSYSFMLEDWARVWRAGLGGGGNEAFLGVITLPTLALNDVYSDYNTALVLRAIDMDSGEYVVQYPFWDGVASAPSGSLTAGVWHTLKISQKIVPGGAIEGAIWLDGVELANWTGTDAFTTSSPMGIHMFQTQSRASGIVYVDDMVYSVEAESRESSDVETGDGTTTQEWIKIRDSYGGDAGNTSIEIDPTFTHAITDVWLYCKFYVPQFYLNWLATQGNHTSNYFIRTDDGAFFGIRRSGSLNRLTVAGQIGFVTLTAGWHELHWREVAGDPNLKIIFDGVEYDFFYGSLHTENPDGTNYVMAEYLEPRDGGTPYYENSVWFGVQELAASLDGPVRDGNYDFRFPMQSLEKPDFVYPNGGTPDPPSYPPYYAGDGDEDWELSLEEGFPFEFPSLPLSILDDDDEVYLDIEVEGAEVYSTTYDEDTVYLDLSITYAQAYGSTDLATVYMDLSVQGGECFSTAVLQTEGEAYQRWTADMNYRWLLDVDPRWMMSLSRTSEHC